MAERAKLNEGIFCIHFSVKHFFIFLFALKFVASTTTLAINKTTNHSCYACIEPLVGYTDHAGSCRFFNTSSPMAATYINECSSEDNYTGEYECRKLVISFRSVDTFLRRDCVKKGSCSWKDRTRAMINTPISDCVYTDADEEKLECIYCCDSPLCNRTSLSHMMTVYTLLWLLMINWWRTTYCE